MAQTYDIIELSRHDSLSTFAGSSSIPSSIAKHNTVYFSSNSNDLSAKFVWNINGSKLEIFSYSANCTNRLLGLFDFGLIFDDPSIAISSVIRLADRFEVASRFRHPYKLIVILSLSSNKSFICIVDVRLNSVLNTIDCPFNITTAEVILSGPPGQTEGGDKWPLAPELLCMKGILAVGCDGGLVFFIDLILDSYSPMPLIPKQISFITNSVNVDLIAKRKTAIFHNQVIYVPLNADSKSKNKFLYRAHDGSVLASYHASQIYVSSLAFVPQLGILCVGYNFGCFHLYNLATLKLEHSSAADADLLPVVCFAFQAPENDPKNFTYLWVVRGISGKTPNVEQTWHKSCCTANMNMLCYEKKVRLAGYGPLYQKFKACFTKFEMRLTFNPFESNSHLHSSSKLLDMFTLQQVSCASSLSTDDDESASSEEVPPPPFDYSYNLLFLSWVARSSAEKVNTFFLLFDLNQYYKTQMPRHLHVDDEGLCPFACIYSLNALTKLVAPDTIQAVNLATNSLSKYSSNLFYTENHSYPSAYSFNLTVASQTKLVNASYLGLQKQMLNQFVHIGPRLLGEPEETVTKCLQYGLVSPDNYHLASGPTNETTTQRELLMTIALENNLTSFLVSTIREWATEAASPTTAATDSDCDLKHILDWLWKKVSQIKNSIDSLTTPLFDFAGYDLTPEDISKLFAHEANLAALSVLLKQLRLHATILTQQGSDQLLARSEIVELIRSYLKIILVFQELSILPEQDETNQVHYETGASYSYDKLAECYAKRRQQITAINPTALKRDNVLLIDAIVHHLEPHLAGLWRAEHSTSRGSSCSRAKSLYPPPNLHSLLRIFLVESIPRVYKECLLLYFLLDFCNHLIDRQSAEAHRIEVFINSLSISQGLRMFIRGLWFLDHENNGHALQFLTHPVVIASLPEFKVDIAMFNSIVQRTVQLFLFANEYKSALIFSQCSGHFLIDAEKNENLYIQMLLLNGNLTGAIDFQRQRRNETNAATLMHNLLFVCEITRNLVKLCRIPLDDFEEEALVEYLNESAHPSAKRVLILYFILNNKLLDAFNVVKMHGAAFDQTVEANRRILELTEAYYSRIPSSLTNLAEEMTNILANSVEPSWGGEVVVRTADEPTIKINAKQRNIKKISAALSIEKVLEVNEGASRRTSGSSPSRGAVRRRSLYLTPNISKSKVTKAKGQQHPSGSRDLFSVLRTPDVLRRMDAASLSSFTTNDSPRKPSILKQHTITDDSESDRMSESTRLKGVSFSMEGGGGDGGTPKKSKTTGQGRRKAVIVAPIEEVAPPEKEPSFDDDSSSVADSQADHSEIEADGGDPNATPRRRARSSKKATSTGAGALDTPSHRMKLRSKSPKL